MNERPLFDPSTTVATACPVPACGAIRLPGQTTVPTCHTDQQRALGDWQRRPRHCLNALDPSTAPFPEGY